MTRTVPQSYLFSSLSPFNYRVSENFKVFASRMVVIVGTSLGLLLVLAILWLAYLLPTIAWVALASVALVYLGSLGGVALHSYRHFFARKSFEVVLVSPQPRSREEVDWPDPNSVPLYRQLMDRYRFHKECCERGARRNARFAAILDLAIPVISAMVVFLAASGDLVRPGGVASLGLILTFLTVVNSLIKPSRKAFVFSDRLIRLDDWRFDFELKVKESGAKGEQELLALLREKNAELSAVAGRLVGVGTPGHISDQSPGTRQSAL
jgi:hypothetical protein